MINKKMVSKNSPFKKSPRVKLRNKNWLKKAQLSIFIILGIMIVVVLLLLLANRIDITKIFTSPSVIEKIQKCVKDSAKEGIDKVSLQGGSMSPKNYYLYDGNEVDYVCYTEEYYKQCVMQKPLLKKSIQDELEIFLTERINGCLEAVSSSLQQDGYDVSFKKPKINVEINPKTILISIDSNLIVSKENTQTYNDIKVYIDSNLYDFLMIESSIANWEARYGDSESLAYMLYYPNLKVEKKIQGDGTRIYILTDRETLEKFIFATRSVPFTAGVSGK